MAERVNNNITSNQFDNLSSSFALDLVAMFNLLQEDVNKIIMQAQKNNLTPEQMLEKIEELI